MTTLFRKITIEEEKSPTFVDSDISYQTNTGSKTVSLNVLETNRFVEKTGSKPCY